MLGRLGLQTRLLGDLERDVAEHTIKVGFAPTAGRSGPSVELGEGDEVPPDGLRIASADRTRQRYDRTAFADIVDGAFRQRHQALDGFCFGPARSLEQANRLGKKGNDVVGREDGCRVVDGPLCVVDLLRLGAKVASQVVQYPP